MNINIHVHVHNDAEVSAAQRVVEQTLALLGQIMTGIQDVKTKVDQLTEKVEEQETVEDSLLELVGGLKTQISDLKTQLQTAIDAGGDPAAIQAVADSLDALGTKIDADKQKLADAVTANT